MKQGLCEIVIVLDRSGSMEPIKQDMMGGFDTFIEGQKKQAGECRVSLYQFDDKYDAVYENRSVADVPKCELVPRGSTALVDAVGKTINAVGERLAKMDEASRPEKMVFLIITDGHENASREFTTKRVREMIEHQKNAYQWEFAYLGADAQAFDDAAMIGVNTAAQYTADSAGTHRLYDRIGVAVSHLRSGATATLKVPDEE